MIADLFSKIHFGEKMGTGFDRIREICEKENAPFPEIEFNENYFYVTFKQSYEYLKLAGEAKEKVGEKVGERVGVKITENQKLILEEISKNRFVTAKQLSQIVGISDRKVEVNIKKLKEKGLLKRIGPDKGGYWEIIGR